MSNHSGRTRRELPGTRAFDVPTEIPWAALDRRYFARVAGLPSPLDELAVDRRLFTGKGDAVRFDSLADIHPLVACLPWLFDEAFPAVSISDVLDIAEAGVFLSMGMLLNDVFQDDQLCNRADVPLLHQHLVLMAQRQFGILFESTSRFWSYLDKYTHQYDQALLAHDQHRGMVRAYTLEQMHTIGSGKVALLKTVSTALALKGQGEHHVMRLENAIDSLTAAMQLGDDIVDWADDYQLQNYTFPLTCVIPQANWPAPQLSVEEVGRLFDSSVIRENLVAQVIQWFQLAATIIDELNCPHWAAFVMSCIELSRDYQESIVARKLLRVLAGQQ